MTAVVATETLVDMYDRAFVEGGFTVFVAGAPMNRFAVSASSEQSYVSASAPHAFDVFRQLVEQAVSAHPNASAIGGWLEEGRIYVDPVETYESRATAEDFGRARNQAAIYDLADGQEVRL